MHGFCYLVGLAELLEALVGGGVARVLVRVVLARKLEVSALDGLGRRAAWHAKQRVVVRAGPPAAAAGAPA